MTRPNSILDGEAFAKLWIHECSRVFHDRLINEDDREVFREIVIDLVKTKFKYNWKKEDIFYGRSELIFSVLLRLDAPEPADQYYEENTNRNKLFEVLEGKLGDYNVEFPSKMDLVFFDDAINHICRISRILRQPRGNSMLIGVSGCGKQSLTKLATYMLEYTCYQIKLKKNYQ